MQFVKNLSIRTKIFCMLGLSIVFLVVVGVTGYTVMQKMGNNARAMYENKMVPNTLIDKLLFGNSQIDSLQNELLLTRDDALIKQVQKQISDMKESNQATRKLLEQITLSTRAQEEYQKFLDLIPKSNEARKKVDELATANKKDEAYQVYATSFKQVRGEMIKSLQNVVQYNEEDAKASYEASIRSSKSAAVTTFSVMLLAIVLCSLIGYAITRLITRPVKTIQLLMAKAQGGDLAVRGDYRSKDEIGLLTVDFNRMIEGLKDIIQKISSDAQNLSASSEQLLASSEQSGQSTQQVVMSIQEIASGADAQLKSTEESVKAMEEMAIGIRRIAEYSNNLAETSVEATKEAGEGNTAIQTAVNQMDLIRTSVNASSDVVKRLGARSKEIGQISDVITEISNQTNLLALNAAIEAARAGENGRGFAVVADEVRKLAEQSRQSAQQIAAIIRQIQVETDTAVVAMDKGTREVGEGTVIMQEAGGAFHKILDAVQNMADQIQEISAASEQMSASTEEVTASLHNMEGISRQAYTNTESVAAASEEQLATMEEISSAVQALAGMSQEMLEIALRFKN